MISTMVSPFAMGGKARRITGLAGAYARKVTICRHYLPLIAAVKIINAIGCGYMSTLRPVIRKLLQPRPPPVRATAHGPPAAL